MAERQDLGRQESLFEGLAPPRPNPWARPPDAPERDDDGARREPGRELVPASDEVVVDSPVDTARQHDELVSAPDARTVGDARAADHPQALHGETVAPPEAFVGDITIERRTAPGHELPVRRGGAETLAGPTLDDVVSRVWEGLATGLPAACPLCHGEIVPALGGSLSGSCTSCAMTID